MRVLVPPSAEILQKLRRNSEQILQNSFEEILWHPAEAAGDVLCTAENFFSAGNGRNFFTLGFIWITGWYIIFVSFEGFGCRAQEVLYTRTS